MLPNKKALRQSPEASPPSGWAPFDSGNDFGKNMSIVFAALLVALALAFTAGALIRRLRRQHPAAGPEKQITSQLGSPPLNAIPAVLFSAREGLPAAGVADCAICLLEFEDGDRVRVLPNCGHGFHVGCIDGWIVSRRSCPTCRKSCLPQVERFGTEGI